MTRYKRLVEKNEELTDQKEETENHQKAIAEELDSMELDLPDRMYMTTERGTPILCIGGHYVTPALLRQVVDWARDTGYLEYEE